MKERNEESYYDEIMAFVKSQIESNFLSAKRPLKVYCKKGELRKGLNAIVQENSITIQSIIDFLNRTPPLSLDIFALITDGIDYQLLIIEVKDMKAVGLQQFSQLVGYSIVGRAKYGLLVNVDGGESPRLTELIHTDEDLMTIDQILSSEKRIQHHYGVMEWDSLTHNLTYTENGTIGSIPKLCKNLSNDFYGTP